MAWRRVVGMVPACINPIFCSNCRLIVAANQLIANRINIISNFKKLESHNIHLLFEISAGQKYIGSSVNRVGGFWMEYCVSAVGIGFQRFLGRFILAG